MKNPILGGTPKTIFDELRSCKILPDATERELFKIYRTTKNRAHREAIKLRIVKSHLRFVFRMACDYASNYQLPVTDFYSAGKLGILTALNEYDPTSRTKFGSFAVWHIRWQMQQFIDTADPIHLPPKVRQRVLKAKKEGKPVSSIMFGEEAEAVLYHTGSTSDRIAEDSSITVEDTIASPKDENTAEENAFLDPAVRKMLLEAIEETLDPREISIIKASFGMDGFDMSSKDIAACTGVSKAHVRTLRLAALEKLRQNSKLQELFEECTGIVKT
jgi:RNA polymerase sigma factor (sigma-70 family)